MKKLRTLMQQIISIAILTIILHYRPLFSDEQLQETQAVTEPGSSIQAALTLSWKLAQASQDTEKRDLIAKAIDDFRDLLGTYKTLINQQPRLEQKVAHTITVLQQRITSAERKLRTAQTQESELVTAQADLQKKSVEIADLRKELTTLQEENNRLRNQVTLMYHEHGITSAIS